MALTLEQKKELRKTTAGSALPVRAVMKENPQLAGIQLDYYLMNNKVNSILYLTDPDAMTPETWKQKARQLAAQMRNLTERMEAMCA